MFATLKRWLAAAPPDKNASGQSLDYWRTRAIAAEAAHQVADTERHEARTRLTKLIEAMQRTQRSLQALALKAAPFSDSAKENRAIAVVLGDFIRLAAELRAGDGERDRVKAP